MRDIFVKQLIEEIKKDSSLILITADLGFGSFDEIASDFPGNFLNVGVAEQNMIGVASGMAMLGRKPFCYSIGNFPTLRCLEQIRNDASYHNLPVTIVGNGGGFSYGGLGVTHHATEDVSILLSIPEVTILTPSTDLEVINSVEYACNNPGTKYLRLDKSFINQKSNQGSLKPLEQIKQGDDLVIFCYGGIVNEAIDLSEMLKPLQVGIFTVPMLSDLNHSLILEAIKNTNHVISLEENSINGGLGSLLASSLLENNVSLDYFKSFGISRKFSEVVGDQNFMRKHLLIDAESIFNKVKNVFTNF